MYRGYLPQNPAGGKEWWAFIVSFMALMMNGGLLAPGASAAERTSPIQVGVLTDSWGPTPQTVGIRDGLLALGYREDEDFVMGIRFTQGDLSALPGAARELVQYDVDLIIADTDNAAKAAQQATSQVPIVFVSVSNPVELGLVKSFPRPGGNITGVANLKTDLNPKRLELLQAIVPALRRVLLPYDATSTLAAAEVKGARRAARRLGIEVIERGLRSQAESRMVLAQTRKDEVDAILAPLCCSMNIPGYVQEATTRQSIPAMFDSAFWPERGALASYGPNYYATGRQAARLVDKIVKGAKPADIPVEVNTKIEFVINLKTAKDLKLAIAPEVLYQADRIIR